MKRKITLAQWTVLQTLVDVFENEPKGTEIILKNRYHSAAAALVRSGNVSKRDCFPYRPRYSLTDSGLKFWSTVSNEYAMGNKDGS